MLLAHGAAGRSDLPVSVWVLAYLAASVVGLTWAMVRVRPVRIDPIGRAAGVAVERLDGAVGVVLRVVGIAVLATVLIAAWFGDRGRTSTPAIAAYAVLWAALPMVTIVVGDVWRMLSPWDLSRREPPAPLLAATHWPAAGGLLAFVWLDLCLHPADPEPIGIAAAVYTAVMIVMARRRGRAWLRTGDGFAAWLSLAGSLAPLHRDPDGRLRARWPVVGLAAVDVRPGTRALLAVVVGSVVLQTTTRDDVPALVACVVVSALAMLAVRDARVLVPVAVAWLVALHLSFVLVQGQTVLAAASDPLGRGWDLFGTADRSVDFGIVPDDLLSVAQLLVLAGGHAAGVLLDGSRRTAMVLAGGALASVVLLLGR